MRRLLSVVVSVYNEEEALAQFYQVTEGILNTISWDYELVFVNDGSRDQSLSILNRLADSNPKVKVVSFSRNFGHEAAMIAGIDYSQGDGIICMDADLQHPPACIPEIIRRFEDGYEVINMVRTKNESAGWFKNMASSAFYKLINALSDVKFESNASDFFAISRNVAAVLKENYREKVRFLRGYVQNVGFSKTTIEYEARARVAGESKYSIRKLFQFSVNTIVCFSNLPLKLGIFAGIFAGFLGLVVLVYTLFTRSGAPSGYATIVILNCFMFAFLFLIVGIIGEYISILFTELKDRPIYIVQNTRNWTWISVDSPLNFFRVTAWLFLTDVSIAAFGNGIFQQGEGLAGGILWLFVVTMTTHFLAGGFLPTVFLPEKLRAISVWMPTKVFMNAFQAFAADHLTIRGMLELAAVLILGFALSLMKEVQNQ